jgi:hypothetical protein
MTQKAEPGNTFMNYFYSDFPAPVPAGVLRRFGAPGCGVAGVPEMPDNSGSHQRRKEKYER